MEASFGERFAFDIPRVPTSSRTAYRTTFDDRFRGESPMYDGMDLVAAAPAPPEQLSVVARAPAAVVTPRRDPRPVMANGAKRPPSGSFQLASASETSVALGYAPADSAKNVKPNTLNDLQPKDSESPADVDTSRTAIYDISSSTVYLPDGRRLEAHSGLGGYMDDVRYVHMRNTGPTPPNVYDLKMRESLFHGVRAIRLIPKDDSKMYGRDGILAHSYMLGPNGQSNGCVSFGNYQAFLDAYLRGDITRLVVVDRLADVPGRKTASDWLSNTLKDLFRRS